MASTVSVRSRSLVTVSVVTFLAGRVSVTSRSAGNVRAMIGDTATDGEAEADGPDDELSADGSFDSASGSTGSYSPPPES